MNKAQVKQLVERQAHAWESADLATIVADFAADGVFISPGGHWQGHAAIRAAAEAFFAVSSNVQVSIRRILFDTENDGSGAVEWLWSETDRATSNRHTAEDAIVFVLVHDQIIYWREYFDTAQMLS